MLGYMTLGEEAVRWIGFETPKIITSRDWLEPGFVQNEYSLIHQPIVNYLWI